ncbi:MAG TPA: MarR family transcriptional regulator [Candidatus Binatia bacterium]|nr:MarR family transcriptional regulator [Candidatus Binatia bacterium]
MTERESLLQRFISLQPPLRSRFRSAMSPEARASLQAALEELPAAQFEVLMLLREHAGGLSMSELALAHSSTAGSATQLVERLVRIGMVERLRDPGDRRVVRVRLSASAQQRCEQLARHGMDHLREVTAALSDQELELLVGLMAKLAGQEASPAEPVSLHLEVPA